MHIKVKKLCEQAVIPKYANDGDSGFDLVATQDVIIRPGETAMVPTGLAFEIPNGYELQIRPRSGISAKTKLRISNSPGTIDAGYRGEVKVLVDNITQPEKYVKPSGDYGVYDHEQLDYLNVTGDFTQSWPEGTNAPHINKRWFTEGTYIIRKGDRIAQGVIAPVIHAELTVADELETSERGANGFGSSGTAVTS